mmetsp:Transcript_72979/g.171563  ORF Transcript_72979/g.171563 Transcript_72979/m.171563 type:complete len:201 (+) Transcript_72979:620-1222(+)
MPPTSRRQTSFWRIVWHSIRESPMVFFKVFSRLLPMICLLRLRALSFRGWARHQFESTQLSLPHTQGNVLLVSCFNPDRDGRMAEANTVWRHANSLNGTESKKLAILMMRGFCQAGDLRAAQHMLTVAEPDAESEPPLLWMVIASAVRVNDESVVTELFKKLLRQATVVRTGQFNAVFACQARNGTPVSEVLRFYFVGRT